MMESQLSEDLRKAVLQSSNNNGVIILPQRNIEDAQFELLCTVFNGNIKQFLSQGSSGMSARGMQYFSMTNWQNLTIISLWKNSIGDKGCKYLSQTRLPVIQDCTLSENNIGSIGILHLSKASWKTLELIYLCRNRIGADSVGRLIRADWQKLSLIFLKFNRITFAQMINLVLIRSWLVDQVNLVSWSIYIDQPEKERLEENLTKKWGEELCFQCQ